MVYSEKDPQKADTRIVDARIVDQISGRTSLPTADATRSYSAENPRIP
jgi:hypothetical protein